MVMMRFRVFRLAAITFAAMTATAQSSRSNSAETTPDIARGRYLVTTILACGNCHTPKDAAGNPIPGKELAGGGLTFNTPQFAGTASNITPDCATGIGDWSADDIKKAITQGIRPDHARLPGTPLAGVMWVNFYKAMTPSDLDAVVAYLRSIPPVENDIQAPVYKTAVVRDTYPDAEAGFSERDFADPVRRGAYLVTIGHCMECHTPMAKGAADYRKALGKGGRKFAPPMVTGYARDWQGTVARNITAHPVAGIGSWADADIKRAITKGHSRNGRRLGPPMGYAWYAGLSGEDLDAIVAWLRTLPPKQ